MEYINLIVRILNHFLEYGFNNKQSKEILGSQLDQVAAVADSWIKSWSTWGGAVAVEDEDQNLKKQEEDETKDLKKSIKNKEILEIRHYWEYLQKYC